MKAKSQWRSYIYKFFCEGSFFMNSRKVPNYIIGGQKITRNIIKCMAKKLIVNKSRAVNGRFTFLKRILIFKKIK